MKRRLQLCENTSGAHCVTLSVSATSCNQLVSLEIELVMFDAADKSVEAVTQEKVDFGLFAVDPVCGAGILLTVPYILIEGAYLVKEDSPVQKTSKNTKYQ